MKQTPKDAAHIRMSRLSATKIHSAVLQCSGHPGCTGCMLFEDKVLHEYNCSALDNRAMEIMVAHITKEFNK